MRNFSVVKVVESGFLPYLILHKIGSTAVTWYFLCIVRAIASVDANSPSSLHKKVTFSILYTYFYKTSKQQHQFIYSTHLFNKIFILLQFFIIFSPSPLLSHRPNPKPISLTTSLSHRPNPPLSHSYRPNPSLSHFLINQTIITILHFIIK